MLVYVSLRKKQHKMHIRNYSSVGDFGDFFKYPEEEPVRSRRGLDIVTFILCIALAFRYEFSFINCQVNDVTEIRRQSCVSVPQYT